METDREGTGMETLEGRAGGRAGAGIAGRVILLLIVVAATALGLKWSWIDASACVAGFIDLKLRDQDEGWGNGVSGTWIGVDLAPGKECALEGSFVQLGHSGLASPDHLEIALSYTLDDAAGSVVPSDAMASRLILSRLECGHDEWRLNLLDGTAAGNPPRPPGYRPGDWKVSDADGDGRITFRDLRLDPLDNLPPPRPSSGRGVFPQVKLGVMLDPEAGGEFMGLRLRVDFTYTLNQWRFQ